VRAIAPSIVFGAVVPLAVYYLVRSHVGGDPPALAIAGVPAVLWVVAQGTRARVFDPIGGLVLLGFVTGLAMSYALGGSAFVLKIRDPVIFCLLGAGCLTSLWFLPRPVMFYVGRALSAGDDPLRRKLFDQTWELPSGPQLFKVITVLWGVGLLLDAAIRIFLATLMATGPFLAASPAVNGALMATMFATTVVVIRRFRTVVGVMGQPETTAVAVSESAP
jgi:hypothetical protein